MHGKQSSFYFLQVRVGSWSHLTDVSGTLQSIYSFIISYTQVGHYCTSDFGKYLIFFMQTIQFKL